MSYPVRPWRGRGGARRDPFAAFDAMQERMSRMFGDTLSGTRGRSQMWHPDIDVDETADGWVIEARLPGVAPDEVTVDITDRELVIRSRHDESGEGEGAEESSASTSGRSRRWSSFMYRLTVPSDVDTERIDATMDHGLLTVTLPRSSESRSRSITVGKRGGQAIEGQVAGQQSESAMGGDAQQAAAAPSQGDSSVAGTDYTSPAGVSQGGAAGSQGGAAGSQASASSGGPGESESGR